MVAAPCADLAAPALAGVDFAAATLVGADFAATAFVGTAFAPDAALVAAAAADDAAPAAFGFAAVPAAAVTRPAVDFDAAGPVAPDRVADVRLFADFAAAVASFAAADLALVAAPDLAGAVFPAFGAAPAFAVAMARDGVDLAASTFGGLATPLGAVTSADGTTRSGTTRTGSANDPEVAGTAPADDPEPVAPVRLEVPEEGDETTETGPPTDGVAGEDGAAPARSPEDGVASEDGAAPAGPPADGVAGESGAAPAGSAFAGPRFSACRAVAVFWSPVDRSPAAVRESAEPSVAFAITYARVPRADARHRRFGSVRWNQPTHGRKHPAERVRLPDR